MTTTGMMIRNQFGRYFYKSLLTPQYVFFTDDSDGIMMFYLGDPHRKPLMGYGAEEMLIATILKKDWTWAGDDMKYNIQCILESAGRVSEI